MKGQRCEQSGYNVTNGSGPNADSDLHEMNSHS